MRALYRNADGTESVGTVVGMGFARRLTGYNRWDAERDGYELARVVHVHFDDFTEGTGAFDELFADDPYLVVGIGPGRMVDALR